jgi:hypothetical protein
LPELAGSQTPWWERAAAAIGAFVIVSLLPWGLHLFNRAAAVWRKGRAYDTLHSEWTSVKQELEHVRQAVRHFISTRDTYQLELVQLHREQLFVIIRKKSGPPLPIGTQFAVFDTGDYSLMGRFAVTAIQSGQYHAQADGDVSPVWLGYVIGTGKTECSPPPRSAAIRVPTGESEDE